MKTLEELRREIDAADKDILDAFARRLQTAKSIGEIKRIEGKPVYDAAREDEKKAGKNCRSAGRTLYRKAL